MCPTLTCPLGTRTRLSLRSVFLFFMYSYWKKSWLHFLYLPCLSNTWSFSSFCLFLLEIIMEKSDVILPVLIAVKQQLTVNSSMVKPDKFRKSDCVGMCIWASGTYVIQPVPVYIYRYIVTGGWCQWWEHCVTTQRFPAPRGIHDAQHPQNPWIHHPGLQSPGPYIINILLLKYLLFDVEFYPFYIRTKFWKKFTSIRELNTCTCIPWIKRLWLEVVKWPVEFWFWLLDFRCSLRCGDRSIWWPHAGALWTSLRI